MRRNTSIFMYLPLRFLLSIFRFFCSTFCVGIPTSIVQKLAGSLCKPATKISTAFARSASNISWLLNSAPSPLPSFK